MKTSQKGINLIKQFEGCRLNAYKPVAAEKYYTIGYGHYGPDVTPGMKISQAQADMYLVADLKRFEDAVNALGLPLNQNQFDALVSFTYNCGAGNLKKLIAGRTPQQIADTMLAYNKGSGKVLAGLTRRRQAERALFVTGMDPEPEIQEPINHNPYDEPTKNVRYNSRGNDVRWLQYELNRHGYHLMVDGIFKNKTLNALEDDQENAGLIPDGICGPLTREKLKNE